MDILFPPNQEYVFLSMAIIGMIMGVAYDSFKIKRQLFGDFTVVLFFDDLIFSLLSAVMFILGVFVFNNGIFRWYEPLFCVLGFVLYRVTLSRLIMPLFSAVIKLIHFSLNKAFFILLFPLKRLLNIFIVLAVPLQRLLSRHRYKKMIYRQIKGFLPIGCEVNE